MQKEDNRNIIYNNNAIKKYCKIKKKQREFYLKVAHRVKTG